MIKNKWYRQMSFDLKKKPGEIDLTIDFGSFNHKPDVPAPGLFQKVKSEMLKCNQKLVHRRKPFQYERLQQSLQGKLKQKAFNKEEQRLQLVMLEKCKNYFQLRRDKTHATTIKVNRVDKVKRPYTSQGAMHRTNSSSFMSQVQEVMDDCGQQRSVLKQKMNLFAYYCKRMNRRLQGIHHTIEKKQRMI